MRIGFAADHAGFELKRDLSQAARADGHDIVDFGAFRYDANDEYPDYVFPLAEAIRLEEVERGIALCGSGIGVCIAANKVAGVRAAVAHEALSVRQGVEDDDLNVLCLGSYVIDPQQAINLVSVFLNSRFSGEARYRRRIRKIGELESRDRLALTGPGDA
ncbi:MAG TPA: RpiB/LacA/LacB family sugar-phosphate isomerase [Phycisphaerae bacterium]|nr:RpiB/LacA/LacB family sugar-phosphate isomerase [Phycisphaerae bacterium]